MAITILQAIFGALLISSILLQARGAGLGAGFGGDGNVFRTKRGIEKRLVTFTIACAILFLGLSLANVLYN